MDTLNTLKNLSLTDLRPLISEGVYLLLNDAKNILNIVPNILTDAGSLLVEEFYIMFSTLINADIYDLITVSVFSILGLSPSTWVDIITISIIILYFYYKDKDAFLRRLSQLSSKIYNYVVKEIHNIF